MNIYKISSDEFWHEIEGEFGTSGGIYILKCASDEKFSMPRPVGRLLAQDTEGVLYIGMASSFLDRVSELKKSIAPEYKSSNHECGFRYKSNAEICSLFPYPLLFLELIASSNPRQEELSSLKAYESKFGELPPLNRAG